MIDGDGDVRITDFGLAARRCRTRASRAGTPAVHGARAAGGRPASVRSDIYALGLILFEMFTGKRVFDAKTFDELLALHETRTVATPSSMVRDLDPAVERVILRCLEQDPSAARHRRSPLPRRCRAAIRWRPRSPPVKRRRRR